MSNVYMIYIGTVLLSCGILLDKNIDACSKVNSSLPLNLRNNCSIVEYINIIQQNTQDIVVNVTSYASQTSMTKTLGFIPTETVIYKPENSNQNSGNYIPTIVGVIGVSSVMLAGTVAYLIKKKNEDLHPLATIDNYYSDTRPLSVLEPPFRRAYTPT